MAEPKPERLHHDSPPLDAPTFSPGTYVVQIPKDQIYRVPPPENALIVERHRNPTTVSSVSRRRCCLRIFLPVSVLLVIVILLAVFLPPLLARPKPPNVKLTKFKLNPSTREFHIDLDILNPNSAGSISFKSSSRVTLFFRKRQLTTSKFPLLRQPHGSERHVALALRTESSSFPKELERRLKDDKSKLHVAMSLQMNLPAKTIGQFSTHRDVTFVVVCSFTVNTLSKNSRIMSQDCQSQRQ